MTTQTYPTNTIPTTQIPTPSVPVQNGYSIHAEPRGYAQATTWGVNQNVPSNFQPNFQPTWQPTWQPNFNAPQFAWQSCLTPGSFLPTAFSPIHNTLNSLPYNTLPYSGLPTSALFAGAQPFNTFSPFSSFTPFNTLNAINAIPSPSSLTGAPIFGTIPGLPLGYTAGQFQPSFGQLPYGVVNTYATPFNTTIPAPINPAFSPIGNAPFTSPLNSSPFNGLVNNGLGFNTTPFGGTINPFNTLPSNTLPYSVLPTLGWNTLPNVFNTTTPFQTPSFGVTPWQHSFNQPIFQGYSQVPFTAPMTPFSTTPFGQVAPYAQPFTGYQACTTGLTPGYTGQPCVIRDAA